jgi:hypothetical protein
MDPDSLQFGILRAAILAIMTSGLSEVQWELSDEIMALYVNKCNGLPPLSSILQNEHRILETKSK